LKENEKKKKKKKKKELLIEFKSANVQLNSCIIVTPVIVFGLFL